MSTSNDYYYYYVDEMVDRELEEKSFYREVASFIVDNFTERGESQHNIDTSDLLCAECHVYTPNHQSMPNWDFVEPGARRKLDHSPNFEISGHGC